MKSEMLKRLVRAIAMGAQEDLDRLAETIVDGVCWSGYEYVVKTKIEEPASNRQYASALIRIPGI